MKWIKRASALAGVLVLLVAVIITSQASQQKQNLKSKAATSPIIPTIFGMQLDQSFTPRRFVALVIGQSNAASFGDTPYTAINPNVYCLHNGAIIHAADPNCTTNEGQGGSAWARLGDLIMNYGGYDQVYFTTATKGSSDINFWAGVNGTNLISQSIAAAKAQNLTITHVLWHQGETDAATGIATANYENGLKSVTQFVRNSGVSAPFYIAQATRCDPNSTPANNQAGMDRIRTAQANVAATGNNTVLGPDTDAIKASNPSYIGTTFNGVDNRCHFSNFGLMAHAQGWLDILKSPFTVASQIKAIGAASKQAATTGLVSLNDGQVVASGVVNLQTTADPNTTYLNLLVDGVLDKTVLPQAGMSTITSPHDVYWDPTAYSHGLHRLEVRAYQTDAPSGIISPPRYLYTKKDNTSLKPFGKIVGISNAVVIGCAVDPDDSTKAIQVGFTVDHAWGGGTAAFDGTTTANLNDTVANNCNYAGMHGFTWTIPTQYNNGTTHSIYAVGIDLSGLAYNADLLNSPVSYQSANIPTSTTVPATPNPSSLPTAGPFPPYTSPIPTPTIVPGTLMCTISGFKVGNNADWRTANFSGSTSYTMTNSQFRMVVPAGNYNATATGTSMLDEGFTICTNAIGCEAGVPARGTYKDFNCPANGFVDIWWFYALSGMPIPTVNLTVNGFASPVTVTAPAAINLVWNSTNATSCEAISSVDGWTGSLGLSGTTTKTLSVAGIYDYAITCHNGLGSKTKRVRVVVTDPSPVGYLDSINGASCTLAGWTCDASKFDASLTYHVYVDGPAGVGTFVGGQGANTVRSDLTGMCGGTTNHGFTYQAPSTYLDNKNHSYYVYPLGIDQSGVNNGANPVLNGSPMSMICACPPIGMISGLAAACIGPNQVRISWSPTVNATSYNIRVDDGDGTPNSASEVGGTVNNCGAGVPHDICINDWSQTAMTININGTKTYSWWVHPMNAACGQYGSPGLGTTVMCNPPTPTPTPTPFVRSYNLTTQTLCADGRVVSNQSTQAGYALWPPNPLNWNYLTSSLGPKNFSVASSNSSSNVYVYLYGNGAYLPGIGNKPHPSIEYGTYFNPPTNMIKWQAALVPSGSYILSYLAPTNWCPTPTPKPTSGPTKMKLIPTNIAGPKLPMY